MNYTQFAAKVLEALYMETEGDLSKRVAFRTMLQKYGIYPEKEFWLSTIQNEWAANRFAQIIDAGTINETAAILSAGVREAEAKMTGNLKPVSGENAKTEIEPPIAGVEEGFSSGELTSTSFDDPKSFDSAMWTGPRLTLTDEKVVQRIKVLSSELRDRIYSTRFENNADSQDLKGLADALVGVCSMAEPELSIIARILSHPKFQISAALVGAVATIRGALGI